MALVVTNSYEKEKKVLSRFYDKHQGCYFIPMECLSEEVLTSLLRLMKYKNYLITGIYDMEGRATINDFKENYDLGYIVYYGKSLRTKNVGTPKNLDIISKYLSRAGYKYPQDWNEMNSFSIPKKDYYSSEQIQTAIDMILYEGMLNINLKEGYSVCLGYNKQDEFFFKDAYEID